MYISCILISIKQIHIVNIGFFSGSTKSVDNLCRVYSTIDIENELIARFNELIKFLQSL